MSVPLVVGRMPSDVSITQVFRSTNGNGYGFVVVNPEPGAVVSVPRSPEAPTTRVRTGTTRLRRSEGEPLAFVNEVDDGYDTLEWIAQQPWSNGDVGMWGDSYYGFTQWAAVASGHPALKAIANLPPLGDAIMGSSPLVTKTMLFVGVTYTSVNCLPQPVPLEKWSDSDFKKHVLYAFDKKTGRQVAVFDANNLGAAGPSTYLYKGKQYLALATGNGPDSELVAYALP